MPSLVMELLLLKEWLEVPDEIPREAGLRCVGSICANAQLKQSSTKSRRVDEFRTKGRNPCGMVTLCRNAQRRYVEEIIRASNFRKPEPIGSFRQTRKCMRNRWSSTRRSSSANQHRRASQVSRQFPSQRMNLQISYSSRPTAHCNALQRGI